MCLENVFFQPLNVLTCNSDLVVVRLLLLAFFLELHDFVSLVEHGLDSLFADHLRDSLLSLARVDAKEVAEFFESDVHVDAADNHDVMFDQGSVKDSVAVCASDVLMLFETLPELLHMLLSNDLTIEELVQHFVEFQRLHTLFFVEQSHQPRLTWTSW